ncbi:hypothetical protein D3C87_1732620 [compost metagenome]
MYIDKNASAIVLPTVSSPWLRSIRKLASPKSACRRGFSSSRNATPSYSWYASEPSTKVLCWLMGSTPPFCALTATPARVWVCSTQPASGRASCTALWMTKPAGFTGKGESCSLVHCMSTLIRLDAVISSNIRP